MSKLVGNKIWDCGIIISLWILIFYDINEQNKRLSNVSLIDLKKLILKFHIFQLTHCVIVEVILNLLQIQRS